MYDVLAALRIVPEGVGKVGCIVKVTRLGATPLRTGFLILPKRRISELQAVSGVGLQIFESSLIGKRPLIP